MIIHYLVIIDPFRCCPQISKIFERIIYNQLSNYFNGSNLLAEQQYGFRPRHSTELAAVKLVDFISHEMESGHTPTNIYVDPSKAFDTINYDILLDKLSYYGISGRALKLLKSYLLDRKQYVVYNNCNSNLVDVTTGVPQGSILGLLLFSIFINDLIHVTEKLKFIMYADDTTIYFNLDDFDPATIERDINSELEKINVWLKLNKLSLNVKKTKSVIFNRKQKQIAEITLSINGEDIEHVEHFNFLGIILDENLSWKNHINMLSNKISKVIGVMYKLKNVLPEYILLILYNSLIFSHLNYGLFVWEIKAERLEILQKKAVRIVTKSNFIAHTDPLFRQLNVLKIKDMFKVKILKFYYKLSYGLLPKYFNSYIHKLEEEPVRVLRRNIIHPPLIKRVYAECNLLFQLIKLINILKVDPNDQILKKVKLKTHSYIGFGFNVTQIFLSQYNLTCTLRYCYSCGRL